jgi:hypothetical protein
LKDLPREVARFDINLAPLEAGNPFCEAKSELKFFEAAICDIPTIASPTGPYARAIKSGETGFLASNADEWSKALNLLVRNPRSRRRIGRAAHHAALWHFGPNRRAELAHMLRQQLAGGRGASYSFRASLNEPAPVAVPLVKREIVFEHNSGKPADATVIIPVFNYARYVEEAMESVNRQTLDRLSLVMVDDASTDASLDVMLRWANENKDRFCRLVIARHTQNSGLGASRNSAFDLADTLYVCALDADNLLRPNCCERLKSAMEANGAVFAYPIIQRFGDGEGLMGVRSYRPMNLVSGNYIDAMAMVAKDAWALVGGYARQRLGWQDFDLWCRFAERGLHGVQVPEVLADYRVHGESMLRTSTDRQRNKAKLLDLCETDHPWLALSASGERAGYKRAKQ